MFLRITYLASLAISLFISNALTGQTINFGSSGLVGENLNNPTSLDFGPNGKLYVAQQNGTIWEYEVQRDGAPAGSGTYSIITANAINEIKNNTPNHNDDGTSNPIVARQITGILVTGSSSNPIIYVTSSDFRIGGGGGAGNDQNLDTNSGLLTRMTWNGSSWDRVDLVRGLPRCEENHSTNGLNIFTRNSTDYLLVQQGGNTNQGAPSNNFAGTSETFLAGALLIVNLTQLEQIETANGGPYLDPRDGSTQYIYDLPTLNDPERQDIDNTNSNFPYGPSHPMYNAIIDLGDPFGGNNGLNQSFPETGGPVQIFSPGYRNAYDVVITADGRIFTQDNGPNGGWGGAPLIYDSTDQLKGTHHTTTYNAAAGDYVTNEFNIENGNTIGDALHYVGTVNDPNNTYYGGHPVPIRAFPTKAGVYNYQYDGSAWVEAGSYTWGTLISGVSGYFNSSFSMADFPDDSRQGEYLVGNISSSKVNILDVVNSSTNGMCEYTASNFDGAMQGNILAASFNGNINRYVIDSFGTELASKDNTFLSGFGTTPLDVIAMGDFDPFPGTIWAATYGADNITIFEPADFGTCYVPGDPEYDPLADYDRDGFTNGDEIANGTNHCSGGSSPNDNDGDFISDLTDTDDDNDGIPDLQDAFANDANNGTQTNLPIFYPYWNNDPGTGFFGLGFTGLMLDPSGSTDYLTQYDEENLSFGGAGGKATIDAVPGGDALQNQNTQENAFLFGINADTNSQPFTIHSKIETPFDGSPPLPTQSYGIFIGTGDQDNYLKVVIMDGVSSGDSTYGFEVLLEDNSVVSSNTYDVAGLLQAGGVDIYLSIDPSTNAVQPYYSLNDGEDIFVLGGPITLPTSFLDPNDNQGLAVGMISTSGGSGSPYIATWDFINITEDQPISLSHNPSIVDFGTKAINNGVSQLNLEVTNVGAPTQGAIDITAINITGPNANLFQTNIVLPLGVGAGATKLIPVSFTPDAITGSKTANIELIHSGLNSPLVIPIQAVLVEPTSTIVRISAGSTNNVIATDGGPDWESNPSNGAYTGSSYAVNTGANFSSNFQYANRHSSIPAYIDQTTFDAIFANERYDGGALPEMEFTIPVANGDYTVNLYLGNSYAGTSQPGSRVFDILLEGTVVEDNLDLSATFGHQVGAMISHTVSVNDGVLNIAFGHEVENPLVNAIEILSGGVITNQPPVAVASATPLSGDIPLNVNFTGSNSTDDTAVTAYSWDFGDGNSSTEADPNHTYVSEGTFNVVLAVFDGEGLSDVDSLVINVTPDLPPTLSLTPDPMDFGSLIVNSSPVNLDLDIFNQGSGGEIITISSINMSGTDATMFGHNANLPFSVDPQSSQIIQLTFTPDGVAGTKTATLELTHDGGNSPLSVTLTAELTTLPPLVLDPIADQFNEIGENSNLVISASGGDPNENITYGIGGQPAGLDIEPTNGQIIGIIDPAALTGGPGGDGIHFVTVTASKPSSTTVNLNFNWTITDNTSQVWIDKNEDESYTARHECSFVQAGDKFFMFGGRENAQTLDVYDYGSNSWTALVNSAPVEFNHFQATEYQGLIWIIGAFKDNLFPIETPADYIWSYNPATNEWFQGPEIPAGRKRGSTGLVVYNDKFYVVGGNTIGHDGGYVPWFDEYDPATGTWTVLTDAPRARDHFHAAVINGKLYAASGRLSGGTGGVFGPVISEVDVYDFATSSWSTLPSAQNIPTPRAATVVANFQNKLVVAGGESLASTSAFSVTEIYDPVTQSWEMGADLVHPRHGTQGIVSGGGIFVAAGSPNRGGGSQLNMEFYGSDTPSGAPSVASTLSSPANVDFAIGETKDVALNVSGGNVGIIVTSLQITGPDAAEFSIDSGDLSNGLIKSNEQHTLSVSHNGTEDNKSATLVVSYNNSNVLNIDLTVGSGANQAPTAVASATPLSGVVPLSVVFTGSNSIDDVSIVSYLWDFKDGNTSNSADTNHTFTGVGTFDVELTVTDDVGLTDLATVSITVDPEPVNQPPTAIATATPLSGDLPLNVSFTGSNSTDDGTIVSYAWDFGDGNSSTMADPAHTYTTAGVFTAGLTVTDDEGLTDFITVDITVSDPAVNLPPVAVASATPTVGLAPLDVSFIGSNSTDDTAVVSYSWDFGDGNSSTLADPVHTFTNPGTYTVTLTVSDAEPLQDQTTLDIIVNDPSAQGVISFTLINANTNTDLFELFNDMQIDIADIQGIGLNIRANTNPNPVGSVGLSISGPLNNTRTESVAPYALYGDAGGNYNSQNFPLGTYTLSGTAYSGSGLGGSVIGTTYAIQFTIEEDIGGTNQPPTAVATATPLSGDFPLNVSFTGSNSTDDGTIVSYAWDFGDGNSSPLADPAHTYTTAGVFTAGLTVTDDGGLSDFVTVDITVTDPSINLPPTAVATATPLSGDFPLNVSFMGSNSTDDGTIVSYAWDFGDGNSSPLADAAHTYTTAGVFTAGLTVTDDGGLTDFITVDITVSDPTVNLPPVAVASATPTVGLAPLDVVFTGSGSTDDDGIVSYSWDFGDGNNSSLADPVHTYSNPGNYTATLTVTDGEALQDQISINITVNDASTQGVIGFTLVNANSNTDLFEITDGLEIDETVIQGLGLNIRANTNPSQVGSVGLSISGPLNNTRTESVAPYALYGDAGGNYNSQNLPLGNYTLTATAYSGAGLGGNIIGNPYTIQFTIANSGSSARQGIESPDSELQAESSDESGSNNSALREVVPVGFGINPNPASSFMSIDFSHPSDTLKEIYIHGMDGRLIKTFKTHSSDVSWLPIFDLEDGLYIVTCISDKGRVHQQKLVVKN